MQGKRINLKNIKQIAIDFRKGLLGGRESKGMCFIVSAALEGYLNAEGYDCYLVEGKIEGRQHFWIALEGDNILDPTSDQFIAPNDVKMPKVYVGKKPNWYIDLEESFEEARDVRIQIIPSTRI